MPRKGENIYHRHDGRWEGRYIKNYTSAGKAQYGYIYAQSYRDVKAKLAEAKIMPTQNEKLPKNSKELQHFCILWLDEMKMQVKQSTYVKYHNIIHNHIIPILGNMSVCSITSMIIRGFIDTKLTGGKLNGGGLSVKSVKDIVSVLKMIFQYAVSTGEKCFCDFSNIKIKSQNKVVSALTNNERNNFTAYLMSDVDNVKLGILISLYAGLRIGEICALKFEDISNGIIHVRRTMQRVQTLNDNKKKTEIIITDPKSSCSIRDVPVPQFLNDIINRFYVSKAFVLTGEAEAFIEPRTLQNKFKAHSEKCGLYGVNYHVTRHTYATMCVEMGFDIKSLSEMLGHSSVNITLNRYVHSSMEMKKRNVEKLQERINYLPSKS